MLFHGLYSIYQLKKQKEIRVRIKIMSRKKSIITLIIGFAGIMAGLIATSFAVQGIMFLPIGVRMVLLIAAYWLTAIVPVIIVIAGKEKLSGFGFSREKIGLQILIGLGLGIGMSAILTLVPHLLGFGNYVDNGTRYKYAWQFCWEFLYCIVGVGLAEEFAFRGFIYQRVKSLFGKDFLAVIISSVLFGFFHILSGNIIQMVITGFIGALFCFFRLKIKNCTTLSIIIAHGVYDALITLMASLLL